MNVAIRVDASQEIGTGHFMRCLTLADGLHEHGALVRFVCRLLPKYLREMLATRGYELRMLAATSEPSGLGELTHAAWLGVSQKTDAAASVEALADRVWDWLVVDHYALDARWEATQQVGCRILVIDDIADRMHDCDLLVDQNAYSNMTQRYINLVPSRCRLLLGPHFALLRSEFRDWRARTQPRDGRVQRILVSFGGVDLDNHTGRTLEALANIPDSELEVDVIIGIQHPQRHRIESQCRDHGYFCHIQTERMAELMARADLAIGAAGSTSWERCCLGLPALVAALANNQAAIAHAVEVVGAGKYLGYGDTVTAQRIQDTVCALTPQELSAYSRQGWELVDGLGVDRVVEAMEA